MLEFEIGFRWIDLFNLSARTPLARYSFNNRVIVNMCICVCLYVFVCVCVCQNNTSTIPQRYANSSSWFHAAIAGDGGKGLKREQKIPNIARKQKRDNSKGTSLLEMYWISGSRYIISLHIQGNATARRFIFHLLSAPEPCLENLEMKDQKRWFTVGFPLSGLARQFQHVGIELYDRCCRHHDNTITREWQYYDNAVVSLFFLAVISLATNSSAEGKVASLEIKFRTDTKGQLVCSSDSGLKTFFAVGLGR